MHEEIYKNLIVAHFPSLVKLACLNVNKLCPCSMIPHPIDCTY